jgi:hypothetical protein
VQQEEAAFAEEDRPIVGRGESAEDVARRTDGDWLAETEDACHAQVRSDGNSELARAQRENTGESDAEELTAPNTCASDGVMADHVAILFGAGHRMSDSDRA